MESEQNMRIEEINTQQEVTGPSSSVATQDLERERRVMEPRMSVQFQGKVENSIVGAGVVYQHIYNVTKTDDHSRHDIHSSSPKKEIEKLQKATHKLYHPKRDVDLYGFDVSSEGFPEIYSEIFQVGFYQGRFIPNDDIYNPKSQGIKIAAYDRAVTINELVSAIQRNNFVSVIDYPGAGKTILSKRLARRLSENNDFLVLRKLFINMSGCDSERLTLKEFLLGDCNYNLSQDEKDSIFEWITTNPEKCFIILDGFDQVSWNLKDNLKTSNYNTSLDYWEILSNLSLGRYLENCNLIFTSRPHAMLSIPKRCRPKLTYFIRDLTFENMKKLFDAFVNDQQQSEVLWHELTIENPHLKSICHNPLMLQLYMRASLGSSHETADISTMTRIFHIVLLNLKASGHAISLNDKIVIKLSKIAYEATKKGTVLISTQDLVEENLSSQEIQDLVVTLLGANRECGLLEGKLRLYFSHQTFQEYFSALYICREMPLPDFIAFVQNNLLDDHWSVVVLFLSGLLLDPYMNKGKNLQKKKIFISALNQKTLEIAASHNDDGRVNFILISKILRESRDDELVRTTGILYDGGVIEMKYSYTQNDFHAATSFLKLMPAQIGRLHLYNCGMTSKEFQPWIEAISSMPGSIVRLDLQYNHLSSVDGVITILHKIMEEVKMSCIKLHGIEEEAEMRHCHDCGDGSKRDPNNEECARLQKALNELENKKLKLQVGGDQWLKHKDASSYGL